MLEYWYMECGLLLILTGVNWDHLKTIKGYQNTWSSVHLIFKINNAPQPPFCCRSWPFCIIINNSNNLLLTEREGHTGEYWPEVVAVQTECSEVLRSVRTKMTEGQYSPVRLEQARLVSSLLYGTRAMLVSKFPAFENKKYTSYDHFHGNGPYGKIPTKKEPIRTPGFTPRLPCHIIIINI